jgi:phage-related protein
MTKWSVELVDAAKVEIIGLPPDMRARFLHISKMLEELGPQNIGMPHIRHLEDDLWEMRMSGRDGIARAIYFSVKGRRLMVVRAFVKKSQKTPRREIDLAHVRAKEWKDDNKA